MHIYRLAGPPSNNFITSRDAGSIVLIISNITRLKFSNDFFYKQAAGLTTSYRKEKIWFKVSNLHKFNSSNSKLNREEGKNDNYWLCMDCVKVII